MRPRQVTALRFPCFVAADTLHERFTEAQMDSRLGDKVSSTLVVIRAEGFDDQPAWQASIAIAHGNERHPIPYSAWTRGQRRRVRSRLLDLLHGVGAGPIHVELIRNSQSPGHFALHAQRVLSPQEIQQVGREFLLAPAWPASRFEAEREIIPVSRGQ